MPLQVEPDGTQVEKVNVYSDLYLMEFLSPGIVFDGPGEVVFCREGEGWRGSVLTFLQSRAGVNLYSKAGLIQFLTEMHLNRGLWWGQLNKREFEDSASLFRAFSIARVMGYLPKASVEEDEIVADLLLLPQDERLAQALSWETDKLLYGTLKIIRAFSDRSAFGTYKSMTYRDKLLSLSSAFLPHREEFIKFSIDEEHRADSALQLLFMFT